MRLPVMRGVIERRVLVNYRVEVGVCARVLPAPFEPKVVGGWAMAGICLIRLKRIRPAWMPGVVGVGSENAAHRFAVEWPWKGERREGVYIPRRDSSSWINAMVGGRLFPGEHHHARFAVKETAERVEVGYASDDGECRVRVKGRVAEGLPGDSVFGSVAEASRFFEGGSVGYSATGDAGRFDGLELRCAGWKVEPLEVEEVRSSYFEDEGLFPAGSARFDCALVMRGIEHEWRGRETMYCGEGREISTEACSPGHARQL